MADDEEDDDDHCRPSSASQQGRAPIAHLIMYPPTYVDAVVQPAYREQITIGILETKLPERQTPDGTLEAAVFWYPCVFGLEILKTRIC